MKPLAATLFGFDSPARLFQAGEKGAWYDPTDGMTMFGQGNANSIYTAQNPAGPTTIALILDKSQGLAASATAIDNNLNTGTWTKASGWTALDGRTARVDGTQVANADLATATHPAVVAGFMNRWTFTISGLTGGAVFVFPNNASAFSTSISGTFQVFSNAQSNCIIRAPAGVSFTISGLMIEYVAGWHALQNTAANRPTLNQSGGKSWLAFNGTTNSMQTQAISFTGAQATAFAGVDISGAGNAGFGMIFETGPNVSSTAQSFDMFTGATTDFYSAASGTAAAQYANQATTTTTGKSVLATSYDVSVSSASTIVPRRNGAALSGANTPGSFTTGTFGTNILTIGARSTPTFQMPMNLYSLIIRGASSNAAQISSTEQWINQRMGAY